jgi:hypothetical protein
MRLFAFLYSFRNPRSSPSPTAKTPVASKPIPVESDKTKGQTRSIAPLAPSHRLHIHWTAEPQPLAVYMKRSPNTTVQFLAICGSSCAFAVLGTCSVHSARPPQSDSRRVRRTWIQRGMNAHCRRELEVI